MWRAGLDLFIPGVEKVGGFSMCSSPAQLASRHTLELAVKESSWPPAHWIHTAVQCGDHVKLR